MSSLQQVVLASGNQGKLKELSACINDLGFQVRPQSDFNCTEAVEDGLSFIENAIKKARHASQQTGLPAIADDSGLEVVALGGAPGIHSARFAGEQGNDAANNQKLISTLTGKSDRRANFRCVLVFLRHALDPVPIIAEGIWHGEIAESPKGENGFGYDPLFILPNKGITSAELSPELKQQQSHRALALIQLKEKLRALNLVS